MQTLPLWRNGRRNRLKICRGQLHVGSSPTSGTIKTRRNGSVIRFRFVVFFIVILLGAAFFCLSRQVALSTNLYFYTYRNFLSPAPQGCKMQTFYIFHLLHRCIFIKLLSYKMKQK